MGEWLESHRADLAMALVVLIAVAAAFLLQVPRRPALQVVPSSSTAGPAPIKVHVVGAVTSPGVYQLEADARVEDALRAAGGPSESAGLNSLNLATPLKDGQQVVIPEVSTPSSPGAAAGAAQAPPPYPSPTSVAGKLDLNAASQKQLEELPGIGPVTAAKILDYRKQRGRITSLEELKTDKVITSSMYEKVKDLVEVW